MRKGEMILYDHLSKHYDVEKNVYFDFCKNDETDHYLPFDFVIKEYKLAIELDGIQQFEDVNAWKSECKNVRRRDIYKTKCANENDYSVLRIKQEDVYGNKIEWEKELALCIKSCDSVTNIFISTDNAYDNHMRPFDNAIHIIPEIKNTKK
jgi:very-short-patch-repair endonuclease